MIAESSNGIFTNDSAAIAAERPEKTEQNEEM